jgi:hypothetical protein
MERSVIRDRLIPDYAEFIIGPAEGRTRWLHPGYGEISLPNRACVNSLFTVIRRKSGSKAADCLRKFGERWLGAQAVENPDLSKAQTAE